MVDKRDDPSTTSADYEAMAPYWTLVDTFAGGAAAMRKAGEKHLPKPRREKSEHWEERCQMARFTNIFGDIVENLASKPFAEELKLEDNSPDRWEQLIANIDGRGTPLHGFANQTFYDGIRRTIDWILVDFTRATPVEGRPLSLAEETAQGLRPFWLHVPATSMIAVYSDFVGGEEIITHARFREDVVERDKFSEISRKRIRVFNREPIYGPTSNSKPSSYGPPTWTLYELQRNQTTGREEWIEIDSGSLTIEIIPLVPFAIGRRVGASWQFVPPMMGAADLQVEHYQAENGLKWISHMTAYPMLAGNGVTPKTQNGEIAAIDIGPRAVLYAPPFGDTGQHGEWVFIEPGGSSLTFLSGEVDKIEKRLRELGRQPLTAESGNLTVVTTAFAAQKGNSAVQAWAMLLELALDRAMQITALWLKEAKVPKVTVYKDFAIEIDDKGPDVLTQARSNKDLTRKTYWEELRRRNILSADFDPEAEQEGLDEEAQANIDLTADMLAATTPKTPPGAPPQKGAPPKPANPPKPPVAANG